MRNNCFFNKMPMVLNGHLSNGDSRLTSCQKGSYLHFNRPIIEQIKINNWQIWLHYNPLIQLQSKYCIMVHVIKIIHNFNPPQCRSWNLQFRFTLPSSLLLQWILVITLTVYYVISVITLETQNTKPFPI